MSSDTPDLLREQVIELVLLHIMMPDIQGFDLLKQLREIKPDLKAIVITAFDAEDIAREAMERDAVDYVKKPLDLNYLRMQVKFNLNA